jgi:hypothetical protein
MMWSIMSFLFGGAAGAIVGLAISIGMVEGLDLMGLSNLLDDRDWVVIAPVAIAAVLGALSGRSLFKREKERARVRAHVRSERMSGR